MCKTRFSRLDSFCSSPLKLYTPINLCSIEMVSITFREIIFSQNSLVLIAACSLSQNWCSYSSATANSKAKSSRSWQAKKYIVKEITTRLPAPLHRQLAEKKQQIWGRIWFTLRQVPQFVLICPHYIQNRLGQIWDHYWQITKLVLATVKIWISKYGNISECVPGYTICPNLIRLIAYKGCGEESYEVKLCAEKCCQRKVMYLTNRSCNCVWREAAHGNMTVVINR